MNSDNHSKLSRRSLIELGASAGATVLASQMFAARAQNGEPQNAAPVAQPKPNRLAAFPDMATFRNPLFAGDFADPSIVRVGDDFYMTFTSYQYAPGLQVWHSRDLVNWEHIADAHARTYGEVWAPDISQHQGRFYIYYPQDGKLFVVHANTPRGPWSEPVDLKQGGIDPCHVALPDGTRYLYYGGADVRQLSADGLSFEGEQKHVHDGWKFPDTWKTAGFWLESPKLMRRGEYYSSSTRRAAPMARRPVIWRSWHVPVRRSARGKIRRIIRSFTLTAPTKIGGRSGTAPWFRRPIIVGISFITATAMAFGRWAATL